MRYLFLLLFALSLTSVSAQKDWKKVKEKHGIKVWTKDYPHSKFRQFKAESTITADLENVVAVFVDVENMGAWYDRVETVTLNKKISDYEATYIIDFDLPWPVSDRISAVKAKIAYDPETNVVTVNTHYEADIITETDKILITKMHSEWILTPKENGQVHIFHKGYMDPEGSLPAWITNSGVVDGPVKTITALKEILPEYADVDVDFIE